MVPSGNGRVLGVEYKGLCRDDRLLDGVIGHPASDIYAVGSVFFTLEDVEECTVEKKPATEGTGSHERLAGATRFELATSGVTGRRSNHAELRPQKIPGQILTGPLLLT
jgi:hypothetical protein